MLTRFHLWFWNIPAVNNRWSSGSTNCTCAYLQQLQSVSVTAYLMACLMVMHSLKVIHDKANYLASLH